MSIEIEGYLSADGAAPFLNWLAQLRNGMARVRVVKRLTRMKAGLLGDWKAVGAGVIELREDYGPGYRIYCARHGDKLIVLLAGGVQADSTTGHRTCTKLLARLEKVQSALAPRPRAHSAQPII